MQACARVWRVYGAHACAHTHKHAYKQKTFVLLFLKLEIYTASLQKMSTTLALTRTATLEVYDGIVKRLSLRDPAVIGLPPYYVEPLLSVQHH